MTRIGVQIQQSRSPLACWLSEFELLGGFKPLGQIVKNSEWYPELTSLMRDEHVKGLRGCLDKMVHMQKRQEQQEQQQGEGEEKQQPTTDEEHGTTTATSGRQQQPPPDQHDMNSGASLDAEISRYFKLCFSDLMTTPSSTASTALSALITRISTTIGTTSLLFARQNALVLRLHTQFPGDVGCFAPSS